MKFASNTKQRQPDTTTIPAGGMTKATGGDFQQSLRVLCWYWRSFLEAKRIELATRTGRLLEGAPEETNA